MSEDEMLGYETIRAAVSGEEWALEKVLERFRDEIDRNATIRVSLPDGSVREEIDEDLRQSIVLALLQAIPHFSMVETVPLFYPLFDKV